MRGAGGRKETGSVKPGAIGIEGVGFAPGQLILVEVLVEVIVPPKEKGVTEARNPSFIAGSERLRGYFAGVEPPFDP